jgi:hypothetical protein
LKSFQRLILATAGFLTLAAPAAAQPLQTVNFKQGAEHGSFIYLGRPLDCSVDNCPKPEEEAEGPAPKSRAMVDAFGMPTNMPTVLRGGESPDNKVVMAPKEAATAPEPKAEAPIKETAAPRTIEVR